MTNTHPREENFLYIGFNYDNEYIQEIDKCMKQLFPDEDVRNYCLKFTASSLSF